MQEERRDTAGSATVPDRTIRGHAEEISVEQAARLSARLIYEVVRRDGEEELTRPLASLIWSGFAAGILISLSVIGEAILRVHLPAAGWAFLVENLGYSLGFIAVIFGRMQLFTENTIATVLPVLARPTGARLARMARLWGVVLTANVLGALFAAAFLAFTDALTPEVRDAVGDLSRHATGMGAGDAFVRAVPAGVLVAALVWMMPSAQGNAFFLVLVFTWLIAAGDLAHIVAGSVEMGFLLWTGGLAPLDAAVRFFLPVLAGNVAGGTAIFAMLAWAQVRREIAEGG
jgi:formate/nitrite transporter FocA (FNT family)